MKGTFRHVRGGISIDVLGNTNIPDLSIEMLIHFIILLLNLYTVL